MARTDHHRHHPGCMCPKGQLYNRILAAFGGSEGGNDYKVVAVDCGVSPELVLKVVRKYAFKNQDRRAKHKARGWPCAVPSDAKAFSAFQFDGRRQG